MKTASQLVADDGAVDLREHFLKDGQPRQAGKRRITAKSANQRRYLDAIEQHDIVFGIGPAGTGKTYLAMAQAVSYLLAKKVSRIVLARPAVEAGEKLGFLPGDLQEKVNPYLRPLYDALYDMLDVEKAERLLERGTIEVAPLAFMRGRTLNDAFVILDEAQNTTTEQMKMFLTRLGFGSKAVVTGDITQIDLPAGRTSGLVEAMEVVGRVEGISLRLLRRARRRAPQAGAGDREGVRRRSGTPASAARGARPVSRSSPKRSRRCSLDVAACAGRLRRPGRAGWRASRRRARPRRRSPWRSSRTAAMRALNRAFRGKDARPTCCRSRRRASAGRLAGAGSSLGDIVIAAGVAARQAREAGHALSAPSCRVLALHGLLHLLGYDHEADDGRMARAEARLRKARRPARRAHRARRRTPRQRRARPMTPLAAVPAGVCRRLPGHRVGGVQRADAALAAHHRRAQRPRRPARPVSRRSAPPVHPGAPPAGRDHVVVAARCWRASRRRSPPACRCWCSPSMRVFAWSAST